MNNIEIIKNTKIYRRYTVSCQTDTININNKRCPDYALTWGHLNIPRWPKGHDYFIGNGTNLSMDYNMILREILSDRFKKGLQTSNILFCDLDGVLADFEQGVKNKFNKSVDELNPALMWGTINKSKSFFETLPWMQRGKELWDKIKHNNPIILTGVPKGNTTAAEQKRKWCAVNLGQHIHVITCTTKEKPKYCLPQSILIDDRTDNLNAWNEQGGKFILYDEEFVDQIVERINKNMDEEGLKSP